MNQRFLISAMILFGTIFIDQVTKNWGLDLPSLHYNEGFIMGFYAGLPDSIRIIGLGSFAGFIFFLYVLLMYVIPARAKVFKYGLSFLVGGMFGNVLDKIIYGKTIDFIPFNFIGMQAVFNMADVFLWIGAFIVLYIIVKEDRLIWYPETNRGNYLIWPREQYKAGLSLMLIVFCCSLILGVFSYAFFNTMFAPFLADKGNLMLTYFISYSTITLLFCTLAFLGGVVLSHKTAGPLYAFELYVDDLIKGKDRKLTFREGDNYKDLERVAERLRNHINKDK
jgi:signal peptidase II